MEKDGPDFISEYVQSRDALIKSPTQAAAVWASFLKFSLQWVAQGNILQLGFADLHPAPFRFDAFDRILWRWTIQKSRRTKTKKEQNQRWKRKKPKIENPEWLGRHLAKAQMTAWDSERKLIRWNIIALPTESFHRAMIPVEKARKRTCKSQEEYLNRVYLLLKARLERNREILAAIIKETDRPTAKLNDRQLFCAIQSNSPRLACWRGKKVLTPIAHGEDGVDCNGGVAEMVESCAAVAVASADAGVPCVSDIRPQTEDLRATGRDLDSTGQQDDGDGATGLRMLASIQKSPVGELLVESKNGGHNGLAAEVQQLADNANTCEIETK